jgi:hypothetical protein
MCVCNLPCTQLYIHKRLIQLDCFIVTACFDVSLIAKHTQAHLSVTDLVTAAIIKATISEARRNVFGWGTMLQVGKSQVRFLIVITILNFPKSFGRTVALGFILSCGPRIYSVSNRNKYQEYSWEFRPAIAEDNFLEKYGSLKTSEAYRPVRPNSRILLRYSFHCL